MLYLHDYLDYGNTKKKPFRAYTFLKKNVDPLPGHNVSSQVQRFQSVAY